jgi:predicted glycoside hydrolase/deacetylase ChbG (UPF0249 family)
MPPRLIVNVDDFGLTPGINRAVAELHAAGAITSATLMANGSAVDNAVAIARGHPSLGVGCHIVLIDGVPLAPREQIPGLLGPDGKTLRPSLADFVQACLRGTIKPAEIELEAGLQIHKLQQAGIRITHLDTHKHTHILPVVTERLLALAESHGVSAIRNPFEPSFASTLSHGSASRRLSVQLLSLLQPAFERRLTRRNRIRSTAGTLGISATGNLNAASLQALIATLAQQPGDATYELCCHPGYNDPDLDRVATRLRHHRDLEREALHEAMPRLAADPAAPRLISYADL